MEHTQASTAKLVSSDKVEGTDVFGRDGSRVGTIDHLVIDKQTGKVVYAVMTFGGFLGMGEDTHHIPWASLHYDTTKDGFSTDISKEQLEGAPTRPDNWHADRRWEEETYRYWRVPPYWM